MHKVYIFFGPPSSGKSYLGKKFAELRGYHFYEADDDYLSEYRERVKISEEEKLKVYDEFYSKVISKIKEMLEDGKSVVVASALGKNIKREFPGLNGVELTKEKEQSLREHLVEKIKSFEKPNFSHLIIDNDYTENPLDKLSMIL